MIMTKRTRSTLLAPLALLSGKARSAYVWQSTEAIVAHLVTLAI